MFAGNMAMMQAVRLVLGVDEHTFRRVAQRQIHTCRELFTRGSEFFNPFARGFNGSCRQGSCKSRVFAKNPEQKMLGLNQQRAELACLIPREKDNSPRLFRIPPKHHVTPLPLLSAHSTSNTNIRVPPPAQSPYP